MPRHPKYRSLSDLRAKIKAYFEDCDEKGLPYTIEDLALALGFSNRQDLLGYQGKPRLIEAINKAKLKVGAQKIRHALAGQAKPSIHFRSQEQPRVSGSAGRERRRQDRGADGHGHHAP